MGRIIDALYGRSRSEPSRESEGPRLGMRTPTRIQGNMVMGEPGGYATHFGTRQSDGRITNVKPITANDYKSQTSSQKATGTNRGQTGGGSGRRADGSSLGVRSGTRTSTSYSNSGPTRRAAGGLIKDTKDMKKAMKKPAKKMKRMNMGGMQPMRPNGLGSQVRAMAQAPNRTGGIGQQVSQMAQAQNRPPVAMPMSPAAPADTGKPMPGYEGTGGGFPTMSSVTGGPMPGYEGTGGGKPSYGSMTPSKNKMAGDKMAGDKTGKLTGRANAMARRQAALDRFKSKKTGSKFADVIANRQASIDSMKARIPAKTMKAGGLVKANGCAQRGKTRGKMS